MGEREKGKDLKVEEDVSNEWNTVMEQKVEATDQVV
jgi:hypothetical protein